MSEKRRFQASVLVLIGLALVGVTVVMLVSLRSPRRGRPAAEGSSQAAAGGERRRVPAPPGVGQGAARLARGAAPPRVPSAGPTAGATVGGGPTPGAVPAPSPSRGRLQAPPVIPVEIQNETDPARKAELMKMHRLTTARVRLATLRRRRDLLRRSLAQGRQQGSWSAVKMAEAERQLAELEEAVGKAQESLDQVRQEVGGDIDKGQ